MIQHQMKHTRTIVFLLFLMMSFSPLKAQRLGGGLILGPTFSTMKMSENDSATFRTDFCGGVRIALIPKHFIIGGEIDVLYSRQGMRTPKGLDENENTIRYIEKSHYINMPLLQIGRAHV